MAPMAPAPSRPCSQGVTVKDYTFDVVDKYLKHAFSDDVKKNGEIAGERIYGTACGEPVLCLVRWGGEGGPFAVRHWTYLSRPCEAGRPTRPPFTDADSADGETGDGDGGDLGRLQNAVQGHPRRHRPSLFQPVGCRGRGWPIACWSLGAWWGPPGASSQAWSGESRHLSWLGGVSPHPHPPSPPFKTQPVPVATAPTTRPWNPCLRCLRSSRPRAGGAPGCPRRPRARCRC